jgi:hypothetical protein
VCSARTCLSWELDNDLCLFGILDVANAEGGTFIQGEESKSQSERRKQQLTSRVHVADACQV